MFGVDDAVTAVSTVVGKIIDRAIPDPAAAAAAKLELLKEENQQALRVAQANIQAILIEAASADKWTSRARPGFLYVMYIMILASLPMGAVAAVAPQVAAHVAEGLLQFLGAIPQALWDLMMTGYLGYNVTAAAKDHGGLVPMIMGKKKP